VTDPRTARIADLVEQLDLLDPPDVRLARGQFAAARRDLLDLVRRGASGDMVQVYRYRAERAHERLVAAWQDAAVRV
jgi:hypothetical protein